jgi:DNA-binding response OmpR family regulator
MARETILILDKESHTQWALKAFLENENYIVLGVDTIERALQCFREFEVSALITEYWIDHTNPVEIIRGLKKDFPELYIMMLTHENLEEKEYKRLVKAGVEDLFLKPLSAEKILLHLKKGLKLRKIFIQKRCLEQKLNQIRAANRLDQALPLVMKSISTGKL